MHGVLVPYSCKCHQKVGQHHQRFFVELQLWKLEISFGQVESSHVWQKDWRYGDQEFESSQQNAQDEMVKYSSKKKKSVMEKSYQI